MKIRKTRSVLATFLRLYPIVYGACPIVRKQLEESNKCQRKKTNVHNHKGGQLNLRFVH